MGGPALHRRALLVATASAGLVGCRPGPTSDEAAAAFLLSHQQADGAFRGATYGLFGAGASLTGLCLLGLRATGYARDSAVDRALAFLETEAGGGGSGLSTDVSDYPTYATALRVHAEASWATDGWKDRVAPAIRWLLRQQRALALGWGTHPAQGGFGFGQPTPPSAPHAGHVDLSMTRWAVRALRAAGIAREHPAVQEAVLFARRCRRPGGFVYAPEEGLNKGVVEAGASRGYGSATADAVLVLRAASTPVTDPDVAHGLDALTNSFDSAANPGVGWPGYGPAMRGYWRAAAAAAFAAYGRGAEQIGPLREAVRAEQQADGSWRNASVEQKEDEPLVATSLALLALAPIV